MKSQVTKIAIQKDVPLAPFTTFKIGGPARFFCEVKNEGEILEALAYAKENSLPIFVLGGGSNVLVSDRGFPGLVIKLRLGECKVRGTEMECGAGVLLSEVVREARENSLSDLEWAAGVPGEFGGAVRGNAGAYGGEIKDAINDVRTLQISTGQIKIFGNKDCNFSYRSSFFKENSDFIIVSSRLILQSGDKAEIETKMKETIRKRAEKLPTEPSPGSFFKNPETDNKELIERFEKDTGKKVTDHPSFYRYSGNKIKIPAPWLIEEAGLKGKKIGGAQVSEKHANFVINSGAATAEDIVMLASYIKMKVRNQFGVQLKEEVQFVGF